MKFLLPFSNFYDETKRALRRFEPFGVHKDLKLTTNNFTSKFVSLKNFLFIFFEKLALRIISYKKFFCFQTNFLILNIKNLLSKPNIFLQKCAAKQLI